MATFKDLFCVCKAEGRRWRQETAVGNCISVVLLGCGLVVASSHKFPGVMSGKGTGDYFCRSQGNGETFPSNTFYGLIHPVHPE